MKYDNWAMASVTSESSQSMARWTKESMEGLAFITEVREGEGDDDGGGEGGDDDGSEGGDDAAGEGRDSADDTDAVRAELEMRAWKILNGSEEILEAVEGDDARQMFLPTSARPKRNNRPSRPST